MILRRRLPQRRGAIAVELEHAGSPAEIGHALQRTPSGEPASLIGAVVDLLCAEDAA